MITNECLDLLSDIKFKKNEFERAEKIKEYIETHIMNANVEDTIFSYKVIKFMVSFRSSRELTIRCNTKAIKMLQGEIAAELNHPRDEDIAITKVGRYMSIEIPCKEKYNYPVKKCLEKYAEEYLEDGIILPIGEASDNTLLTCDLTENYHIMVGGTSGSGKTTFLHNAISSLLLAYEASTVEMVLFDYKGTEFIKYKDIAGVKVIDDASKFIGTLESLCQENMRRNELFKELDPSCNNIEIYNELSEEKMSYIIVVLDEYAASKDTCGNQYEQYIEELTRVGRSTGIRVIIATQDSNAKLMSREIRANIITRISFKVIDKRTSKMMLNYGGAEQLLGTGDCYCNVDYKLTRAQTPFTSAAEQLKLAQYIKKNRK